MRKVRVLAPAKVNLTFDIIGTMPDGYHEVQTLLQAIDLADDIIVGVEDADAFSASIVCTNDIIPRNFPVDDTNLMVRAARLFAEEAKLPNSFRMEVTIEKNIPIGAGLAGGSADGAAVLVALNELYGKPLTTNQLCNIGQKLGADVPFCIVGGTCIGTRRGDVLSPVRSKLELSYCIVKPRKLSVATPWAYQQFDEYKKKIERPSLQHAVKALEDGDLEAAVKSFGNVFEPVIFDALPELEPVKQQLLKVGCWCCHLSGSGPALFALVADREQAHYIRRKILKTDDLEFDYVRLSTPDLGPPLEFYIAQTSATGVTISSTVQAS